MKFSAVLAVICMCLYQSLASDGYFNVLDENGKVIVTIAPETTTATTTTPITTPTTTTIQATSTEPSTTFMLVISSKHYFKKIF